ncbi:uncharacterized protein METZ01_LOCUS166059 [marine metagenome]|uniref:Uncharacterized protein n=1 Tax=marine metagenome TaxID=408172 RepID=A0A382BHB5_9ZZZZ
MKPSTMINFYSIKTVSIKTLNLLIHPLFN